MKFDPKIIDVTKIFSNVYDSTSKAVDFLGHECLFSDNLNSFENIKCFDRGVLYAVMHNEDVPYVCFYKGKQYRYNYCLPVEFTDSTYTHRFVELLKKKMIENYDSILSVIQKHKNSKDYCETEKDNLNIMETIITMYKKQLTDGTIPDEEMERFCKDIMQEDYNDLKTEVENELKTSKASENVSRETLKTSQKVSKAENSQMVPNESVTNTLKTSENDSDVSRGTSESSQNENLKDILIDIKNNHRPRVESKNISLKEYMKTLKDFYGELTIHTLKDNYDDSFTIQFFTDKITDEIINTLENYKDYEVFDVRDSQYCSYPPIDRKCIILDNRKDRSFW